MICFCFVVIRDVSPITGGHAVSKVRLMDEDEVMEIVMSIVYLKPHF